MTPKRPWDKQDYLWTTISHGLFYFQLGLKLWIFYPNFLGDSKKTALNFENLGQTSVFLINLNLLNCLLDYKARKRWIISKTKNENVESVWQNKACLKFLTLGTLFSESKVWGQTFNIQLQTSFDLKNLCRYSEPKKQNCDQSKM